MAPPLYNGSKVYGPHFIGELFIGNPVGTVYQQIVAPQIEVPYYPIIVLGEQELAQTLPGDTINLNVFCKLSPTISPAPAVPIRYWFLFTVNWLSIGGPVLVYRGMWDLALRNNILFKWIAPTHGRAGYEGQVQYTIASEMLKVDGTVSTTFAPTATVNFTPDTAEASFALPGAPGAVVTWPPFNSGRPSF